MSAFSMKSEKKGDLLALAIVGNIDEEAVFQDPDLAGVSSVTIDLDKVGAINSVGIREWIKWTKSFGETKIQVHNVPKIVVDQVNMVAGFLPKTASVQSFYVPYYADDSGEEKMVLFKRGEHFGEGGVKPPAGIKDSEGAEMEMDIIEAKYFKFLTNG